MSAELTPDERARLDALKSRRAQARAAQAKQSTDTAGPCAPTAGVSARLRRAIAEVALSLGWALTPLRGKRPLLQGWQERASSTNEEVNAWIDEGHNLGLRTGSVSGILVLDDDTGTQAGADHFGLSDAPTVTAETSPGKRHYYYRLPEGVRIGNSVGKLFSMPCPSGALDAHGRPKMVGLDVRGEGGQVVLPGSIHPNTKQPYRYLDELGPDEIEVAELPPNVLAPIQEKSTLARRDGPSVSPKRAQAALKGFDIAERDKLTRYAARALESIVEEVRSEVEGQRNHRLNGSCYRIGRFIATGLLDYDEARDALWGAVEESGLDPDEIENTIDRSLQDGESNALDPKALLARLSEDVDWTFANFTKGARSADRTLPDDDEAHRLTEHTGGNGRLVNTALKVAAGRVLKKADLHAYSVCFEDTPIAPDAESMARDELLAVIRTLVAPMAACFVREEQLTPRLVYALTYNLVPNSGTPGWRQGVWASVLEAWDDAEATIEAEREVHEREVAEHEAARDDLQQSILAGQRDTFLGEHISENPDEALAWSRDHLAFIDANKKVYLVDRSGHLTTEPYTMGGLSRGVEDIGLEALISLTEVRGKATHVKSGQEIVNGLRPWDVGTVEYAIGLEYPRLKRQANKYGLVLPQYRLADIDPRYDADIDAYLHAMFGERYDDICRCLASVPQADMPMAAIVIEGPDSIGKGMIAHAIAQVYAYGRFCSGRVFDRFNAALTQTPVVFFDEGLPPNAHNASVSQKLRSFIGGGQQDVERKGIDIQPITTNPRVMISTNDLTEVVRILVREALSRDSQRAVSLRLHAFKIAEEARGYLKERGNWNHTRDWCDGEKRLFARHILWLHAQLIEEEIALGNRFLAEPTHIGFFDDYILDDSKTVTFVETVCRLIHRPGDNAALVGADESQAAGLYLQRTALAQVIGAGLGTDRNAPTALEIESAGARAGLLEFPDRATKLKGTWSRLNKRSWRTVNNWQLVHKIAQRNGCEHLDALEAFLVSIGVLDAAEYGRADDAPHRDVRKRSKGIFPGRPR